MKLVTPFPISEHLKPEQALDSAKQIGLTTVLIAGYDGNGALQFRNSNMTKQDALWIIEHLKKMVLDND